MIPDAPAWLLERGPPWWAFILALLTNPATWSRMATDALKRRFGGQEDARE